jgi:hypothetical protein
MKIMGLLALLVIFSLCISESPITTTPPKTTQEPTETPTYTPPTTTSHATTPSPTAPTPTTPVPVDYERNICEERQLPENLIQFVKGLDYDNNANDNEIYVADTAKDFIEKGITPEITEELFNLSYKKGGKEDLEDLVQNIDSSIFRKIIEDNLIENHEIRLIDKSFTYSDLQTQLKNLNDKASENFLKTYKVVLDKSESGRTEPEKFLYNKIDEHLPEFVIGEDGFLYYGKEKIFKVDDKNLYVKWLTEPYNPIGKERWKIWEKRNCDWQYSIDKEFSLCWSKFIGEKTGIPWVTKYYSVKPIENNARLFSSGDAALTLDFDIFGFNGLGYEQLLDIYI